MMTSPESGLNQPVNPDKPGKDEQQEGWSPLLHGLSDIHEAAAEEAAEQADGPEQIGREVEE
jgi:hypothetical protein